MKSEGHNDDDDDDVVDERTKDVPVLRYFWEIGPDVSLS